MRRLLREPLVHFFLIGALVFFVYRRVAPTVSQNEIVVPRAIVDALKENQRNRSGRPPSAEEEKAILDRWVEQEILYREALALQLDEEDLIVRRRLIQKMEFLTEAMAPQPAPTGEQLAQFLATNADRYAVPERITFTHVFVARDRHADPSAVIRTMKSSLDDGADPATLGDPYLHGRTFSAQTESGLASTFGTAFARQLFTLPIGTWAGPIDSSFGSHLVRVEEHRAARRSELDDVRDQVEHDWTSKQMELTRRRAIKELRSHYRVRIE